MLVYGSISWVKEVTQAFSYDVKKVDLGDLFKIKIQK